jgi:hypothetical protein
VVADSDEMMRLMRENGFLQYRHLRFLNTWPIHAPSPEQAVRSHQMLDLHAQEFRKTACRWSADGVLGSRQSGPGLASVKKTARPSKQPADPAIAQAIRSDSSQRIQQTIEKLVRVGTRQTLSVNNPGAASSHKGIVAARNWIKSEFERYSTECGGSAKSSNRFSFRHSSRKRPLKLST